MQSYTDKGNEGKSSRFQEQQEHAPAQQLIDNRTSTVTQNQLIGTINSSPKQVAQREQIESQFGDAVQLQADDEELLQGKFSAEPVQHQSEVQPNNTGLPDNLKSGIESLSGYSMDDVKVHYNSNKPSQLQAHAYAQGTDIHLASGQEKHLPHEAWHVVQQKQGRVKPTVQMKGISINADVALEKEADRMGAKSNALSLNENTRLAQPKSIAVSSASPYQLALDVDHIKSIIGKVYDALWGADTGLTYSAGGIFQTIYDLFGNEDNDDSYTADSISYVDIDDPRFSPQNGIDGVITYFMEQGEDEAQAEQSAIDALALVSVQTEQSLMRQYAYAHGGDYFHIINAANAGVDSDERMILNIKKQTVACALAKHIADKWDVGGAPDWRSSVNSAKFLANSGSEGPIIKYDKVVIYYEKGADGAVQSSIKDGVMAFLGAHGGEDALNTNISAFYDKLGKGIGVGAEVSGTSFTTERARELAGFIDGKKGSLYQSKAVFVKAAYENVKWKMGGMK